MAENLVSKFTINSQGTDIDVKIKDEDARNLIAQEISDRDSAVTTIINNLNKEISDRESADTALDERITQETTARENADTALGERITQETTDRENAINNIHTSTLLNGVIFLGDSVARGWGGSSYNETMPCTYAAQKIGIKNFYDWTANRGGFSSEPGFNYLDVLKAHENIIADKKQINLVMIVGGINDWDKSTLSTTIPETAAYIKTNYPNAVIKCLYIGYNSTINYNTASAKLEEYKTNCNANGIGLIDGTAIIRSVLETITDGVHINNDGSIYLGNCIANTILTNKPGVHKVKSFNLISNQIQQTTENLYVVYTDDTVVCQLNLKSGFTEFTLANDMVLNGNNAINAFKLPATAPAFLTPYVLANIPTYGWANNSCHLIKLVLALYNRELYIYPTCIENNNFVTAKLNSLIFDALNFTTSPIRI